MFPLLVGVRSPSEAQLRALEFAGGRARPLGRTLTFPYSQLHAFWRTLLLGRCVILLDLRFMVSLISENIARDVYRRLRRVFCSCVHSPKGSPYAPIRSLNAEGTVNAHLNLSYSVCRICLKLYSLS